VASAENIIVAMCITTETEESKIIEKMSLPLEQVLGV